MSDVILVMLSTCVEVAVGDGASGGTGDGGGTHGCFLRDNGRSGFEGQCLGGVTAGWGLGTV